MFECNVFSTTHAYILYANEQAATAAYESTRSNPVHLDGRQLIVLRYQELPTNVWPGTLDNAWFPLTWKGQN